MEEGGWKEREEADSERPSPFSANSTWGLTSGVVERGPRNDQSREGETKRKDGTDKGKSTLMRHAKTKASISEEPIYDRAAIRYKCICADRNLHKSHGAEERDAAGERRDDREMPEGGLEEGPRTSLGSRAYLSAAWINYEIGGSWTSSSAETTFCLPRGCYGKPI